VDLLAEGRQQADQVEKAFDLGILDAFTIEEQMPEGVLLTEDGGGEFRSVGPVLG
jgi:hypothetical protein